MSCGFLIQLVFCKKKKKRTMWFIGVEVEQETSTLPPKKNPGSAPVECTVSVSVTGFLSVERDHFVCHLKISLSKSLFSKNRFCRFHKAYLVLHC